METGLIQSSPLALQIGVKQEALQYLTPVQMGWLEIAKKKSELASDLSADELEIQKQFTEITVGIEKKSLADLEAIVGNTGATLQTLSDYWNAIVPAIKRAKDIAGTSKAKRLEFTTMLSNGVVQVLMLPEKRNDILIADAEAKELKIRQALVRKQGEGQALESEKIALKTHIENEYFRMAADFRLKMEQYIHDGYSSALRGKTPVESIPAYKEQILIWMRQEQTSDFQVFKRTLVNDKDAMDIYQSIRPYDKANDLITAINKLENKFTMYAEDLKNAEAALKVNDEQYLTVINNEEEQTNVAIDTNKLMASSSLSIEVVGSPKVKTKKGVVVENTDAWARSIIRAFVNNWDAARQYLAVKTWGNLKLEQMATALGKLATENQTLTFDGLTLENIEK